MREKSFAKAKESSQTNSERKVFRELRKNNNGFNPIDRALASDRVKKRQNKKRAKNGREPTESETNLK